MNLAKKIIIIFSFFGVSRKTSMTIWILFAGASCTLGNQFDGKGHFSFNIFLLLFWIMFIVPSNLFTALQAYRDDDVLPNLHVCQSLHMRVVFNLINSVVAILSLATSYLVTKTLIWSNFLWLPCIFFYAYFLLNQGTRSKHTLKGIVRWLAHKAKSVLSPAPQRQPLPQPSPA